MRPRRVGFLPIGKHAGKYSQQEGVGYWRRLLALAATPGLCSILFINERHGVVACTVQ